MTRADVVIVGGGVVGSAAAYWLTRRLGSNARILLCERDPSYTQGATGRSAGGVRQQFSTPENIALSQATLELLRHLKSEFGPDADVSFREQGYLVLASKSGQAVLEANVRTQRVAGADVVLLEPDLLHTRFSWLDTSGVACGSFGQSGEGWVDPAALSSLFRKAAVVAGAKIIHDNVVGIDLEDNVVRSVRLAGGRDIATGALVNAAGPWAGALARLAGLALPVEPRKRYVYVIDSRKAGEDLRRGPLTVDPSGVWFRPEGRTFICGISPDENGEPPAVDLDHIDYAPFEEIVWPTLAQRVPVFEEAKVINAWAGFYDYNTLDQNAVIGAHPDVRNFYFANGFSGHGLQQGYGAGRAVAELIAFGEFRTIDLKRFGYERIVRGEPLFEANIF